MSVAVPVKNKYQRPKFATEPGESQAAKASEQAAAAPQAAPLLPPWPPLLSPKHLAEAFEKIPFSKASLHLVPEEITQLQAAIKGKDGLERLPQLSNKLADDVAIHWQDPERQANWHKVAPKEVNVVGKILKVLSAELDF